ncbi:MAG: hypothetical protein ACREMY_14900 [bacterium]
MSRVLCDTLAQPPVDSRTDSTSICERISRMKSAAMILAVLASAGLLPIPAGALHQRAGTVCAAAAVQYRTVKRTPRGVAGVPWVASTNSAFRGYLFYWGGTRWARTRPHAVRIFTTNAHLRVHPKVLWVSLGRSSRRLAIHGTRLDEAGSFSASYPAAIGGGQYPSYVTVPAAGCWRVALRSGSLHGSVTFLATDKP